MEDNNNNHSIALHWKILISILLAFIVGILSDTDTAIFGVTLYSIFDFIGSVFVNALKMIIVPLVASSIVNGISNVSDRDSLGRMGVKTLFYYLSTTTLAVCTGLIIVNLIAPGNVAELPIGEVFGANSKHAGIELNTIGGSEVQDIISIFHRMIPANIVAASAEGNMLGLIFFSLLFGVFMSRIQGGLKDTMRHFWQGTFDTMMLLTMWVMQYLAPIGIFGLVAKTITETGLSALMPLFVFFITVVLALSFHLFVTLPIMLRVFAKVNPIRHYKAMLPAMLTAFSSASSSASLPMTIECVEKNANVSNKTSSFVLPLGATVNMDGTALYECVVVIFLMQLYGLEVSVATQFSILILALITSIGVAGVPAASLVAIVIILNTVGLPVESIGIIMVTERLLDMYRTAVNVFSDSCGAVIIAKSEGEKDLLTDMYYYK